MSYHDIDPNRVRTPAPIDAPMADRKVERHGMGWGLPIAIVGAIAIISIFYFNSTKTTTIAGYDAPVSRQVNSDTPTRAPTPTPPTSTQ